MQKRSLILLPVAILLLTVLAAPVSAQAWVFLEEPEGGEAAEQQYFISQLPEAVRAVGWVPVGKKKDSDLYITTNITASDEFGLNTVTVELYNTKTDEFLATNAMGYSIVEEMDEWNRYLIYELTGKAPRFDHQGSARALTWSERLWGVDRYWLQLGLRGGGDLRYYSPMQEANTTNFAFDVGIQALVQPLPFLALQVEALFTMDNIPQFRITTNNEVAATGAKNTASSLMVPMVLMITFRPDDWLIGPFGGAYFNFPLGQMKTREGNSAFQWQNLLGLGWTAGIEVGRKVGPGTLFTDIRYTSDLGNIISQNGLVKSRRTGVSLSLGYEFALFRKKAKGAEETTETTAATE